SFVLLESFRGFYKRLKILGAMAEEEEDRVVKKLRKQVADKAWMAISLCSITNDGAIAPHWKLFSPILELIQATVTDEQSIPYFISQIDRKVTEMRRKCDLDNINDIITCNVLQMFASYVKMTKLTPTETSKISDAHAEIERLTAELFTKSTELEGMKHTLQQYDHFKKSMVQVIHSFNEEFDGSSMQLLPITHESLAPRQAIAPAPTPAPAPTKRPKKTQMVRRTVVTETRSAASLPPIPVPTLSLALPSHSSVSVHSVAPSIPDMPADQYLRQLLGPDWNAPQQQQAAEDTVEEAPVRETRAPRERRKKRTIEDLMAEMAGDEKEEESEPPKRSREETEPAKRATRASKVYSDRRSEETEGLHQCPFDDCDRTFQKIPTMLDHTTSDHYWIGALQIECSECGEHCEGERSFETHLLNCPHGHMVLTVNRWDPEETEEEAAERQMREKRLLNCPFDNCNYSTKQRSRGIFKHISKSHRDEGRASYRCECGKMRRTFNTILMHHYQECRDHEIDWWIEGRSEEKEKKDEDQSHFEVLSVSSEPTVTVERDTVERAETKAEENARFAALLAKLTDLNETSIKEESEDDE
ncbi:hypothetical protein PFISCL1PPCAC_25318, partial [Pristionchus fissidentatus]